ncbi:hypothetical protein I3W98_39925, partial [Streptomyces cavourensis]|nr:hypothetical protein [Streptomyces cavourensis]
MGAGTGPDMQIRGQVQPQGRVRAQLRAWKYGGGHAAGRRVTLPAARSFPCALVS